MVCAEYVVVCDRKEWWLLFPWTVVVFAEARYGVIGDGDGFAEESYLSLSFGRLECICRKLVLVVYVG